MSCNDSGQHFAHASTASEDLSADAAGMWVFVVGPSGAGKDTLMRLAQDKLRDCPRIVFARRIVTRPHNAFEDHDTASEAAFITMQKANEMVLHWQAHGLFYGIQRRWQDAVNSGRIVVCNVSRTIIPEAVQRLNRVSVVLITASPDVLAARIAARGRDQAKGSRTSRDLDHSAQAHADIIIDNAGTPDDGADRLQQYLRKLNRLLPPKPR
ncbi:MAG: phosphonate metabolism protein/1,5-bisphosphokinase (PRPP-forming) PhnN [Pseudomonadota bacterium]